jgi:hypothetical protein
LRACHRGHRYSKYWQCRRKSLCICTKHGQYVPVTRLLLVVGAVVQKQARIAQTLLFSICFKSICSDWCYECSPNRVDVTKKEVQCYLTNPTYASQWLYHTDFRVSSLLYTYY